MSDLLRQVKDFIISWNEEHTDDFYKAARTIWEHPELSMQEHKSSAVLQDLLKANGFAVESGTAGMPTAFIASYGQGGNWNQRRVRRSAGTVPGWGKA